MFCIVRPNGRVCATFKFEYEAYAALRELPECRIEFRFV